MEMGCLVAENMIICTVVNTVWLDELFDFFFLRVFFFLPPFLKNTKTYRSTAASLCLH